MCYLMTKQWMEVDIALFGPNRNTLTSLRTLEACLAVELCKGKVAAIFNSRNAVKIKEEEKEKVPDSKTKLTEKKMIELLEKNNWDAATLNSFTTDDREEIFRTMVDKTKHQADCSVCSKSQKFTAIKEFVDERLQEKLSKLASKEKALMFRKRFAILTIFGNGQLLLNPLYFQCPICGTVISLGHFNDLIQKGDKVYHHINIVHYLQKSSWQKGIAFLLLKRLEEYTGSRVINVRL